MIYEHVWMNKNFQSTCISHLYHHLFDTLDYLTFCNNFLNANLNQNQNFQGGFKHCCKKGYFETLFGICLWCQIMDSSWLSRDHNRRYSIYIRAVSSLCLQFALLNWLDWFTVLIYILWLKGWAVQKMSWYTRYKKLYTKTMEFSVDFVRPVWLCQCKHTKERTCFKSTFFTFIIIDDL